MQLYAPNSSRHGKQTPGHGWRGGRWKETKYGSDTKTSFISVTATIANTTAEPSCRNVTILFWIIYMMFEFSWQSSRACLWTVIPSNTLKSRRFFWSVCWRINCEIVPGSGQGTRHKDPNKGWAWAGQGWGRWLEPHLLSIIIIIREGSGGGPGPGWHGSSRNAALPYPVTHTHHRQHQLLLRPR